MDIEEYAQIRQIERNSERLDWMCLLALAAGAVLFFIYNSYVVVNIFILLAAGALSAAFFRVALQKSDYPEADFKRSLQQDYILSVVFAMIALAVAILLIF